MALIDIKLFPLGGLNLSANVSGVYAPGRRAEDAAETLRGGRLAPRALSIPWRALTTHPDTQSYLSWHTALSDFKGRDAEMVSLLAWANDPPAASIKLVSGEGGVGKSRLAAEFGKRLQDDGWSAGTVTLTEDHAYELNRPGTLLIVDYPEEQRVEIADLIQDLARANLPSRIRVLLVSRQGLEPWLPVVEGARAVDLLDRGVIMLHAVGETPAYEIYTSAVERVAEHECTTPLPVSQEALAHWLSLAPENAKALFVVAAAIHAATHPDDRVVRYSGREVVTSLVRREMQRLRPLAERHRLDGNALVRLLAVSAIAGPLEANDLQRLADQARLNLGQTTDLKRALSDAGLWRDGALRPPSPDILAACMAIEAFREGASVATEAAPEWMWAAMIVKDPTHGMERMARLSHDAETVLSIHDLRPGDWLAQAIRDDSDRASLLGPHVSRKLPQSLLRTAITVERILVEHEGEPEARARLLNNLSTHLSDAGDNEAALEAIGQAVEIYRRLAAVNPARYEPDLASSLNNQSNRLSDAGDNEAALEAIGQAVEIYRRLAAAQPARYEPDLASSLNNQSAFLSDAGANEAALEAAHQAVTLLERHVTSGKAGPRAQWLAVARRNLGRLQKAIQ